MVFLMLSWRGRDYAEVRSVFAHAHVQAALLAVLSTIGFMAVKTIRWGAILRPLTAPGFNLLHQVTYLGSAANLLVMHSGEVVRAVALGRRCDVASSAVLASIVLERVFDVLVIGLFVGLALVFGGALTHASVVSGGLAFACAIVTLALLLALLRATALLNTQDRVDWLKRQLDRGLPGVSALRDFRAVIRVLVLSVLQWSFIVAAVWLSAFSVGQIVPVSAAIGVWVLIAIGVALPTLPVQLGTVQLAYTFGLSLSDADRDVAFTASMIYICTVNVPILIAGAVSWLAMRIAPAAGEAGEARMS